MRTVYETILKHLMAITVMQSIIICSHTACHNFMCISASFIVNNNYYKLFQHYHSLTIDDSHLSVLVTALSTVYQWFPLGIRLGLSHPTLKTIGQNQRGQVERCRIDILDLWLKSPGDKRTKQFLQNAL